MKNVILPFRLSNYPSTKGHLSTFRISSTKEKMLPLFANYAFGESVGN